MFKTKITPILAATALVVAVFGSTPLGHAAGSLILARNSVGTAQLKKNAVTGPKIRKNAVTGAKLSKNAVTSVKVKNGTLLAADFKAGQLPRGPQGPAGPQGPKGDPGVQGSPGPAGTARAYGSVRINGAGNYELVPGSTKNVVALAQGLGGNPAACIQLDSSIDAENAVAVATPNNGFGLGGGWDTQVLVAVPRTAYCGQVLPNAIEVHTTDVDAPGTLVKRAFVFAVM